MTRLYCRTRCGKCDGEQKGAHCGKLSSE
ncbi:uncharacterized protein G2W53_007886 [Senna tora]|uniref:Uncharacterized protein n=1 Tax=Senna tora TaxID=362788 RepID=A0A834X857_9FABA|nr:uncharacterized protein G2W53_007886 [Senna tora]